MLSFQNVAAAIYLVGTQIFWCDGNVLGPDIIFEQLLQCPIDHVTSLTDKTFCLISQQSLRTGSGQMLMIASPNFYPQFLSH